MAPKAEVLSPPDTGVGLGSDRHKTIEEGNTTHVIKQNCQFPSCRAHTTWKNQ